MIKKLVNITLLTELYLKQEAISQIYSHLRISSDSNSNQYCIESTPPDNKKIYSVTYAPDYMTTVVSNPMKWTEKIFPSVKGYAISINNNLSADDYLRQQNKKQHENINRALKRLENCFNIRYKMFQKNIEKEEYLLLMGHLKTMIIKRFEQRDQKSDNLTNWDKMLSTSLKLMQEGKASLFVIYDQDLPIAVSFNYIYGNLFFGYISSYNIDYYKFSLGQIIIYKLLEWCLDNQFTQYDMGWGDFDYKKWWCNYVYQFNHRIIYKKYSAHGFLYASIKGNKSRIIAFIIAKGLNVKINQIKKKIKNRQNNQNFSPQYKFIEIDAILEESMEKMNEIHEKHPIDKKIINHFLFVTQEHSSNVSLYYSQTKDIFILKGKKETKGILFNH